MYIYIHMATMVLIMANGSDGNDIVTIDNSIVNNKRKKDNGYDSSG